MAVGTVQLGSAIAKQLFAALGPGGAALLRVGFAALVLLAISRPTLRGYRSRKWLTVILFGLAVSAMNLSFYFALDRIPLGIAVTLEFMGPLGVAVAGSRRPLDVLWVVLAGCGIILLAPWGGAASLNPIGVGFALLAGSFWAAYIYLSARVGRAIPGGGGLALAMTVGGFALLPIGIGSAGINLLQQRNLLLGALVGLLSSVIPYSLELEALRTLPTRVFGVLMSLEPAMAALIGFLILRQVLGMRAIIALVLVTVASLGAARTGATPIID
ncbi:MAG: EamA family transporter [Chloroflexota bacterium]